MAKQRSTHGKIVKIAKGTYRAEGANTGVFEPYKTTVVSWAEGGTLELSSGGTFREGLEKLVAEIRRDAEEILHRYLGDAWLDRLKFSDLYIATGEMALSRPQPWEVKLRQSMSDPSECQHLIDARTVLRAANSLSKNFQQTVEADDEFAYLLIQAVRLGEAWQRMKVRPFEPHARVEKERREKVAGKLKAKKNKQKAQFLAAYRRCCEQENHTNAVTAAAAELEISLSTAKTYLREKGITSRRKRGNL